MKTASLAPSPTRCAPRFKAYADATPADATTATPRRHAVRAEVGAERVVVQAAAVAAVGNPIP